MTSLTLLGAGGEALVAQRVCERAERFGQRDGAARGRDRDLAVVTRMSLVLSAAMGVSGWA